MKTFNVRYRSLDKLEDFIFEHEIIDCPDLLIQVFSYEINPKKIKIVISNLRELFPKAHMIGTTTDGEIINGRIMTKDIIISFTLFETTRLLSSMQKLTNGDDFAIGRKMAKEIICNDTKAMIIFAKSKEINAKDLLEGISSVREDIVVSGALSADQGKFEGGYVFNKDNISDNSVVAITLSSNTLIAKNHYTSQWEPVGREFVITKSKANRLISVDKMSVKSLYEKYLGEEISRKLPLSGLEFPFVLKRDGEYIAKTALSDPKDGSLIFGSDMPKGEKIQIGFGDAQKMLHNVWKILHRVNQEPVESIFIYASAGRRRFLKQYAHYEIEPFSKIAPVSGFYGYGEFLQNKNDRLFLNQSFTLLALSEKDIISPKELEFKEPKDVNKELQTFRALANIAKVSSMELQELNQKLERRIREEVEKNRKKDSILIHNSKLAQMGEMMSLIAHQWRQPLSAISATSTGLHVKIELDKFDREFFLSSLDKIEQYVKHLSTTIDDFTNFFKPSKRVEEISVDYLIDRAIFIMSASISKNSIDIIVKNECKKEIRTYPNEVIQVLINLLKNAENILVKREIKNPEIVITAHEKDNSCVIEIEDNAGGIEEKLLEKIFEPYFTTKDHKSSTGLGLYMSKFIIEESCHGKLFVENGSLGAKFSIVL